MNEKNLSQAEWGSRKVSIVGAGDVGASFAYALMQNGAADQIALIDVDEDLVRGQVDDLSHGRAFASATQIAVGDKSDYADSQAVVITAGSSQKPGESRLDLLGRNARIVESIMDDVVAAESPGVVVMVTNPVDVLTAVALERSGWPRHRVIGSGTVLDTARFRHLLSRHCGVDVRNVHAYILGEHGDSEIAPWSMAHIAGASMEEYCHLCGKCSNWKKEREEIVDQVRHSAYHIIDYKGATNWAIGLSLTRIVGAILRNERSVLTVSVRLEGEFDIEDVCLSVPCVVTSKGVDVILHSTLTEAENEKLHESARVLKKTRADLRTGDSDD